MDVYGVRLEISVSISNLNVNKDLCEDIIIIHLTLLVLVDYHLKFDRHAHLINDTSVNVHC